MSTIYISVRRQVILNNKKFGRDDPPFEIRQSKVDPNPVTVHNASFTGTMRLVYDAENPLMGGAIIWYEIDTSDPIPQGA